MQNQYLQQTQGQSSIISPSPLMQVGEKKSKGQSREHANSAYIGNKEPWTEEEEFKMIVAHKKYKNKWSEMTELIKGRNNNTIKNKFYSVFRKIKSKIVKTDYNYETKLELLETYYIISLMEYHLEHPTQYPKTKGKRGKDFIYSLITNLTLEMVQSYKEQMQKIATYEIEELIQELAIIFSNDGLNTQHQTPAFSHPVSEDIIKNIRIESQTVLEPNSNLYNIELEELLGNPFKFSNPEISPILELGNFTPGQLLSPVSFSAGSNIARSNQEPMNYGGFDDISAATKALAQEKAESNIIYKGTLNKTEEE